MAEINLLQGANRKAALGGSLPNNSTLRRSGTGLLVFLIIFVLLEAAAYGGLWFYRSNSEKKIQETENSVSAIDGNLASRRDEIDQAVSAQARIQTFDTLLARHIHWTEVWDELAATTLTIARFVSMEADTATNQFKVSGKVSTFSGLGKLLLGLETSEYFIDVEFNNATVDEQGLIAFDLLVTFDPDIFDPLAANRAS